MGLFKSIVAQAEPVFIDPIETNVPTFRSRRSPRAQMDAEWDFSAEDTQPEKETSGVLFDAFADRLASMRKQGGKIG